jgi:hypothetical protein
MAEEITTPEATQGRGKPPALMNTIIRSILRSPLHGLLSKQMMLITFTGRKTGKEYTTPVTMIRDDAGYKFFSSYNWWKNLRGGAPVTLLVAGQPVRGVATAHEDRATVLREAREFLDRNGVKNAWRIGLQLDPKRPLTDEVLSEALQRHVFVSVQPS